MWNENAPLELLKGMPHDLDQKNLDEIQKVINDDKFINSMCLGRDLCGEYAPFCQYCKKTTMTPCALAYVNMKIAEGMDIGLAPECECSEECRSDGECQSETEPSEEGEKQITPEDVGIRTTSQDALAYEKPLQITGEGRLKIEQESSAAKTSGKKIRIAIARRRKS